MECYEQVVIKLFEHCGFTYDPGPPPEPSQFYSAEIVEMPYAEFSQRRLPLRWMRPIALHLNDTNLACEQTHVYISQVPSFLLKGNASVSEEWLEDVLRVIVDMELRMHVFCFIMYSEFIRDKIEADIDGQTSPLVPKLHRPLHRSRLRVKELSQKLAGQLGNSASETLWVMQQLSQLDIHCRRTCDSINALISEPDAGEVVLIQRFSNVQAAMLDIARVLLDADCAVEVWDGYVVSLEGHKSQA